MSNISNQIDNPENQIQSDLPKTETRGWIAVDLDGTLAKFDRWVGPEHIGAPIPLMLERVKQWLDHGMHVKIFTARVGPQENHDDAIKASDAIAEWCIKHIGRELPITARKDYDCIQIWDDRAITVEANTGRILTR